MLQIAYLRIRQARTPLNQSLQHKRRVYQRNDDEHNHKRHVDFRRQLRVTSKNSIDFGARRCHGRISTLNRNRISAAMGISVIWLATVVGDDAVYLYERNLAFRQHRYLHGFVSARFKHNIATSDDRSSGGNYNFSSTGYVRIQ